MSEKELLGIVSFSSNIFCSADVLGKHVDISIAGYSGRFFFPSLPNWKENEEDPLHMPLVSPVEAQGWKRGDHLLYWGSPDCYPSGESSVESALFKIPLPENDFDLASQKIYTAFKDWLKLFEQYVVLETTQNTRCNVIGGEGDGRLELFVNERGKPKSVSRNNSHPITIILTKEDVALHYPQLKVAADLASRGVAPRLEYRLLLQAYFARREGDYRKSVIEAATALEISITERIREEFQNQNINFGEELLKQYSMLGKRFKLLQVLGINFPQKDYHSLILDPRNKAIHKAEFPTRQMADRMIGEVLELLRLFSPIIHED